MTSAAIRYDTPVTIAPVLRYAILFLVAGVVLPQVASGLGLSTLLFRNYFRRLPADLLDAALIDGCGYLRFFWHVTMPLARPIVATVGVIIFVHSWNNYLLPLVVLNRDA